MQLGLAERINVDDSHSDRWPQSSDQTLAVETAATILVVEDEALIQMVIADYLRDCGYRILEAGTACEAIRVLCAQPNIDIVFTDIQMPGDQNGFDLCRWVRAHMPQVSVILTSGREQAANLAENLCHEGPLLSKPYHLHDVHERIRFILDRSANVAATR